MDDGMSASDLRQRYERGGTVRDSDLSAAQLRSRYAIPGNSKACMCSGGTTVARYVAEGMVEHKFANDFYLSVDPAVIVFTENWDLELLKQWYSVGNDMAILSVAPKAVELRGLTNATVLVQCSARIHSKSPDAVVEFNSPEPVPRQGAVLISPVLQTQYSEVFHFGQTRALFDVRSDPHTPLISVGHEYARATRFWTRGYDFYAPNEDVLFARYQWQEPSLPMSSGAIDDGTDKQRQRRMGESNRRIRRLLGLSVPAQDRQLEQPELFALGSQRSMEAWQQFSGVDPRAAYNESTTNQFSLCGAIARTTADQAAAAAACHDAESQPQDVVADPKPLPSNEALRPYVTQLLQLLMEVLQKDNEDNALIALKTLFDLHRNYRPALRNEVQPFLELVQLMYKNLQPTMKKQFSGPPETHKSNSSVSAATTPTATKTAVSSATPAAEGAKEATTTGTEAASAVTTESTQAGASTPRITASASAAETSATPTTTAEGSSKSAAEATAASTATASGSDAASDEPICSNLESFKTISELPLIIMLLFQCYPSYIESYIPVLVPLMMSALALRAPDTAATTHPSRYLDFLDCQVKTLSFVTYLLRGCANLMRPFQDAICENTVKLLVACPKDAFVLRKDIFVAARHIISTDFRRGFYPQLELLMNDDVLIGKGRCSFYQIRPLAYSTLADMIHHVRDMLTLTQVSTIVDFYGKRIHDPTLPISIQTTSIRLLLNLVDISAKNEDPDAWKGRNILSRILLIISGKFGTTLANLPVALATTVRNKSSGDRSDLLEGGAMDKIKQSSLLPKEVVQKTQYEKKLEALLAPHMRVQRPADSISEEEPSIRDIKSLLRTMILGIRAVIWCTANYRNPLAKDLSTVDANTADGSGMTSASTSQGVRSGLNVHSMDVGGVSGRPSASGSEHVYPLTDDERLLIAKVLRNGLRCFVLYTLSENTLSEEKQMLDHFAGAFTVLEAADFRDLFIANIELLYECILQDHAILTIPQHFLANSNVSCWFAEILLKFLITQMKDLSVEAEGDLPDTKRVDKVMAIENLQFEKMRPVPQVDRASIVLRLFKIVFGSVTLFKSNESALFPHLLVRAILSRGELAYLGLRTLEFWVDNLNPDFLYPIMTSQDRLLTEIIEALNTHLIPPPYPYGELAMRILGKIGGRNRQYLMDPLNLDYNEHSFTGLTFTFQWGEEGDSMDIDMKGDGVALTSGSRFPMKMDVLVAQATKVLRTYLQSTSTERNNTSKADSRLADVDEFEEGESLARPSFLLEKDDKTLQLETETMAKIRDLFCSTSVVHDVGAQHVEPMRKVMSQEALRATRSQLLQVLFETVVDVDVGTEARKVLEGIAGHLTVLALANCSRDQPDFAVLSSLHASTLYAATRGLSPGRHLATTKRIETLRQAAYGTSKMMEADVTNDFYSFVQAVSVALSSPDQHVVDAAKEVATFIIKTTIARFDSPQLAMERGGALFNCMCEWCHENELTIIKALFFILSDHPPEVSATVSAETGEALVNVVKTAWKVRSGYAEQLGDDDSKIKDFMSCVAFQDTEVFQMLVVEFLSPKAPTRQYAKQCINTIASLQETTASALLYPYNQLISKQITGVISACYPLFQRDTGEKLLEHLKQWRDPERIIKAGIWKRGEEPAVAAAIVDLFHLLPPNDAFLEPLINCVVDLEAVLPKYGSYGKMSSPYRIPLTRFLNRYASMTVSFFLKREHLVEIKYSSLFQQLVKLPEAAPLHGVIIGDSGAESVVEATFNAALKINASGTGEVKGSVEVSSDAKMQSQIQLNAQKAAAQAVATAQAQGMTASAAEARGVQARAAYVVKAQAQVNAQQALKVQSQVQIQANAQKLHAQTLAAAQAQGLSLVQAQAKAQFASKDYIAKAQSHISSAAMQASLPNTAMSSLVTQQQAQQLQAQIQVNAQKVHAQALATAQAQGLKPMQAQEKAKQAQATYVHRANAQAQAKIARAQSQGLAPSLVLGSNSAAASGGPFASKAQQEALELHYQGLRLVRSISKLHPTWLASQTVIIDSLRKLWRSSARVQRLVAQDRLPIKFHLESKLLIKCMITYSRAKPEDVQVLLDMVSVFLHRTPFDFSFLQTFYREEVAAKYSAANKRNLVRLFLRMLREPGASEDLKVHAVQLLIMPVLTTSFEDPSVNNIDVMDLDTIMWMLREILASKEYSPEAMQSLRIELLKLGTLLIQHMSKYVTDHRKEVIKFAWNHLKAHDLTSKLWAYVNVCRFISVYDTPPKIVLQVYVALLRTHEMDARFLVRKAFDILLPALPSRLPSNEFIKAIKWTKKIAYEEGHLKRSPSAMSAAASEKSPDEHAAKKRKVLTTEGADAAEAKVVDTQSSTKTDGSTSLQIQVPTQTQTSASGQQQGQTAASPSSEANRAANSEDDFELSGAMVDLVINFAFRFALASADKQETSRLAKTCGELFDKALRLWPSASIRFSYFDKLIAVTAETVIRQQQQLQASMNAAAAAAGGAGQQVPTPAPPPPTVMPPFFVVPKGAPLSSLAILDAVLGILNSLITPEVVTKSKRPVPYVIQYAPPSCERSNFPARFRPGGVALSGGSGALASKAKGKNAAPSVPGSKTDKQGGAGSNAAAAHGHAAGKHQKDPSGINPLINHEAAPTEWSGRDTPEFVDHFAPALLKLAQRFTREHLIQSATTAGGGSHGGKHGGTNGTAMGVESGQAVVDSFGRNRVMATPSLAIVNEWNQMQAGRSNLAVNNVVRHVVKKREVSGEKAASKKKGSVNDSLGNDAANSKTGGAMKKKMGASANQVSVRGGFAGNGKRPIELLVLCYALLAKCTFTAAEHRRLYTNLLVHCLEGRTLDELVQCSVGITEEADQSQISGQLLKILASKYNKRDLNVPLGASTPRRTNVVQTLMKGIVIDAESRIAIGLRVETWRLGLSKAIAVITVDAVSAELGCPQTRLQRLYISILDADKRSAIDTLASQTAELALHQWQGLPRILSRAHLPLMHLFHKFVEVKESIQMMEDIKSASAQHAALPNLKPSINTWRERLPNKWEPILLWDDILTWRSHMFQVVKTTFAWSDAQVLACMHDSPWSVIKLAHTARKQRLPDVCLGALAKLYSVPAMDVQDAFSKLREQVSICYESATEYSGGLSILNTTNLDYFSLRQKAEMFRLKALFLEAQGSLSEANKTFSHCLQICDSYGKGWLSWGHYCYRLFLVRKDLALASQTIACYLQAIHHRCNSARLMIARVLWLLNMDDRRGVLIQAFETHGKQLPIWIWIIWIPQLLMALGRPEAPQIRGLLRGLSAKFPQALYYTMRAFFLENRDNAMLANQQLASGVSPSASASSPAGSRTYYRTKSGHVVGVPITMPVAQVQEVPGLVGPPRPSPAAFNASPSVVLTLEAWTEKVRNNGGDGHSLKAEVGPVQRDDHPVPARARRRASHAVHALLLKCYQLPRLTKTEPVPKMLRAALARVCRKLFVLLPHQKNDKHEAFVDEFKGAFERDFTPLEDDDAQQQAGAATTLYEIMNRLKRWKGLLQLRVKKVGKRNAGKLYLEQCSRHLMELSSSNMEVPGQYVSDSEPIKDLHARIQHFKSTVDVLLRNGFTQRRVALGGSDGRTYYFLVQYAMTHITRTDERMMQMYLLLNRLLLRHKETKKRNTVFHVPKVIPLTPRVRLLEDNRDFVTLGEVYELDCQIENKDPDLPVELYRERVSEAYAVAGTGNDSGKQEEERVAQAKARAFQEICNEHVPETLLAKYVHGISAYSDAFDERGGYPEQPVVSLLQGRLAVVACVENPTSLLDPQGTGRTSSPGGSAGPASPAQRRVESQVQQRVEANVSLVLERIRGVSLKKENAGSSRGRSVQELLEIATSPERQQEMYPTWSPWL
ncbi:Glycosyltransferase, GlcNAc [Phytophthora cactorum]|nr:Glycosyltransferase, GlcNAc [Phytophthora cactorum]